MSEAEVREVVVELLTKAAAAKGAGPFDPSDGLHLVDSGLLDSFAFLDLLTALETRFGVQLDLTEADPDVFLRLGGLARLVEAARGSR
jgi:acyl carrier protein